MRTLRLALFVCDIPPEQVVQEDGDYPIMFKTLFEKAAQDYDKEPVEIDLQSFQVCDEQFPSSVLHFDGVVISGSKASAYEQLSWIKKLKDFIIKHKDDSKWIGICFGHQIIAEALGGKVERNPLGWEVGHCSTSLNQEACNLFQSQKRVINIQQMHKDHVTLMPEGFVNLAFTDVSQYQMMCKGQSILSIQAHPEFTGSIVKKLINLRAASGVFVQGREDVAHWLQVVDEPLDGVWFAQRILDFIITH